MTLMLIKNMEETEKPANGASRNTKQTESNPNRRLMQSGRSEKVKRGWVHFLRTKVLRELNGACSGKERHQFTKNSAKCRKGFKTEWWKK